MSMFWRHVFCYILLLVLFAYMGNDAMAQSVETPVVDATLPATIEYVLGAGPLAALVYGAWLLGKGLSVSLKVRLEDEDRDLLKRGVEALEKGSTLQ